MASYQMKRREPLLDQTTQAAIERRGKELLGIGLMLLAALLAMTLGSYVTDDPSWLSATDAPAQNLLGRFGASIASPIYIVVGYGGWALVAVPAAWGVRLAAHWGEDRALSRVIFAPFLVCLASVYTATHVPTPEWTHSFGMGGLFGDTVLGAVLGLVPIDTIVGLKLVSALVWLGALALGLFVMGVDRDELRRFGRGVLLGLILSYDALRGATGRGLRGALHGAVRYGEGVQARRSSRADPVAPDYDDGDDYDDAEEAPARGGLFSRLPVFRRRADPDLIDDEDEDGPAMTPAAEERIRARIADVIRSRATRSAPVPTGFRPEPPVVRSAALTVPQAPAPGARIDVPEIDAFEDEDGFVTPYEAPYEAAPQPVQPPRPSIPVVEPRKLVEQPPRKSVLPSRRARDEAQPGLQFDDSEDGYQHPPLSLLTNPDTIERHYLSEEALEENARMLENVLDDYGVKGEIVSVRPGPVVTMYELEPAPGLKASRVIGLADDIARSMSALSARVSTVPGRSVIGIELPNARREKVVLREILSARDFGDSAQRLPLALGKDIGGDPVVANLAKMPHLLIAGTTGSGKSVAINTMILSLLYKLTPDECRLIMIDPKMLELSVYDGIPHLLSPVVTDPKKAVVALKWVVGEMEERYRKMSKMGVRNIEGYNGRVRDAMAKGEMFKRTVQTGFDDETGEPVFETEEFLPKTLPYIVVIVDEMADLMMVAGKEIEACIQRLAQMARASGIHLIMATQRPSVDVITGTIKANFPTRISFQVTGKIDSRTILGEQGAEQLLGMGDMLYMAGGGRISRVHGPFVSDEEVEEIVNYLKTFGPPDYVGGVVEGPDEDKESDIDLVLGLGGNTDSEDALYDQAVAIVIKDRKCSTSYIQRKLAIGYNKAARLVEQMEDQGVVSAANHVGKREILVPEQA
ncbi:cell division protein FtsK [Rhodovulum sulfidophilum]|uniref:DNA translocase FtsK n=1 Tax=Rhodovulum visakhapatnamense TaxID=364297 RepID=A0ABS1RCJ9_9RHOB|nr:DNA translocase FtsK [Rhodovulum visakhapatnamense]MBL3567891.1 DNA translocase FtsK 4TM domain-containing protein [Rhodovulum visakhapatnamense]MBL3577363.1 DNA translocase FtsK 4TM domain-containing protein [Rhodovulum visakhapatnamense]OLS46372.1 cell division protein FtsK [Rhodovulum sulfidophilum]